MTSYLLLLWVSCLCDHQTGTTICTCSVDGKNTFTYISFMFQLSGLLLALIKPYACVVGIRTYVRCSLVAPLARAN